MPIDKHLLSYDIKTGYKKGERTFENATIDYAQMEGINLENIVFKNCRFNFSSFRYSKLKNSKFIKCEFFFGSFFGSDLENVMFENTRLEITRFDTAIFNKTVFKNRHFNYASMIDTNINAADFRKCIKFNIFINPKDITEEDLKKGLNLLGPAIEKLDIGIKTHIKSVLNKYSNETNVNIPAGDLAVKNSYGKEQCSYTNKKNSYKGQEARGYVALSDLFDEIINAYKDEQPRKKSTYDKKDKY